MKLAITDACIFIDLIDLQLTSEFFGLPLKIHTTLDVYNELFPEQKEFLKAYQSVGKLTIHIITEEDKRLIFKEKFPKALSESDKTVIYLASKIGAMILSSDKPIRRYSGNKSIEVHGLLWIFDKLIESQLVTKRDAVQKIRLLISKNIMYNNNIELQEEIQKRIRLWSS